MISFHNEDDINEYFNGGDNNFEIWKNDLHGIGLQGVLHSLNETIEYDILLLFRKSMTCWFPINVISAVKYAPK